MAASVDFIESCPLNNNNTDVEMNNEEFGADNRQDSEDAESKLDDPDEKGSESTIDSPYGSVMSETDPSHSGFFPTVKRRGSRGRRFRVSFLLKYFEYNVHVVPVADLFHRE